MLSSVEQLIYTSFDDVGFTSAYSKGFPLSLESTIKSEIIDRYWDAYQPPPEGFTAVYLHQINRHETLFGWLYNECNDDRGRKHVPYFLIYYVKDLLEQSLLEEIITLLEKGPLQKTVRSVKPESLNSILVDASFISVSTSNGVDVPQDIRNICYIDLKSERLLHFFTPEPLTKIAFNLDCHKYTSIKDIYSDQIFNNSLKVRNIYSVVKSIVRKENFTVVLPIVVFIALLYGLLFLPFLSVPKSESTPSAQMRH